MAIRPVPRDPEGIELLRLYAALHPLQAAGAGMGDPARLEEFLDRARRSVQESLASEGRVQGLRAQALFRATLLALGRIRLLTDEDAGAPYYDDVSGRASPPDFRVVDEHGEPVLIEVKSVKRNRLDAPLRLRCDDVEAWRRWGELTGLPVHLAVYWVHVNQWTLVALDRLSLRSGKYEIDLIAAMEANELVRFGDCLVATRPPLTYRHHVQQFTAADRKTGRVGVRVTGSDLLASGRLLRDELERRIARYFIEHGSWEVTRRLRYGPAGEVTAIDLVAEPPELNDEDEAEVRRQGFAMVGTLSSLYVGLFNAMTLAPDGAVAELDHEATPGELADLIPDDYWESEGRALPLWRFEITPTDPGTVRRTPGPGGE